MDLTEAEDIKKRWQENTELYKKDLNDPDNHNRSHHHGYLQSTSCKMLDWMKHKQQSRSLGEISITSNMQMTPWGRKQRETKQPLDEDERGE